MPSRKSERDNSVRVKISPRAILSYTIAVLPINGIVFYLMYLFSPKDFLEHLEFTPNYDIILTEVCGSTQTGSLFFETNS